MHTDIARIGDLSADAVFIYDRQSHCFTYLNDVCERMLGIGREQLRSQPKQLLALIESEDSFYLDRCYHELLEKHYVGSTEFRVKVPGEGLKQLSCSAYLLGDETAIVGFVKDITLDRQHTDYIINYGAKKDTLLDMMSHNLSGPLALSNEIISWMSEHSRDRIPSEIWSQINLIKANTQECLDIVNDFLKREHLESEHIYVKKSRFDVLSRITETLDKLIETNKNKQFRLITNLENLNINTDSVKFFQIVHNLVSNAIKFTPDNGQIDIIVEETETTFIIRVRDNGIGIPPELHSVLFNNRTPAKRDGLNNQSSNGIGLSIVKKLTDLLGGTVSFNTTTGTGSEFSIELPKA
ncbi:MAG: PAS domain-containing sensor histidine kinase [Chitinophagaceae bacterium]|nr:MAG: PAS domain-containing sensor histidine kinase [Chitinophagaceae bacterium]